MQLRMREPQTLIWVAVLVLVTGYCEAGDLSSIMNTVPSCDCSPKPQAIERGFIACISVVELPAVVRVHHAATWDTTLLRPVAPKDPLS